MNQPGDPQQFLNAARLIRGAGSVADVASTVLRGVLETAPRDTVEWRLRGTVRSAVECRLHRLELLLARRAAASPELAQDMRLDASHHLQRLLSAVTDNRELAAHVAGLAVAVIAGLAGATDALTRALARVREDGAGQPSAIATMGGRLFIPAPVYEFAREHGIDESTLRTLLHEAAAPLRRACESDDVCRVGQLRYTRRLTAEGVTACAQLDTSTDVRSAPLIHIRLTASETAYETGAGCQAIDTCGNRYSARLLRQLVS